MGAAPRPRHWSARTRRTARAALLTVLAIVTVATVGIALSENRGVPTAGATPGASAPPAESIEPPTTTDPAPSETAAAAPPAPTSVAATRALAAVDASTAIRAAASTCPEPTTMELTTDGGATWTPVVHDTVSAVQRVGWDGDALITAIGLSPSALLISAV